MADNLGGAVFAPTFDNAEQGRMGQSGGAPQGAIQTLNFRLPRVTGGGSRNALSPLVGDTPRSSFGGAVLRSVLQTILGPDEVSAYMGGTDFGGGGNNVGGGGGRDEGMDFLSRITGQSDAAPSGGGQPPIQGGSAPQAPQAPPPASRAPIIIPGDDERIELSPEAAAPKPTVPQVPDFDGPGPRRPDVQDIYQQF